jgi:DNA uptake protein ComE-like DNA-binding protein
VKKKLEGLRGIGPVTAKRIIAGRPYSCVIELTKAGISLKVIAKISPLIAETSKRESRSGLNH